MHTTAMENGRLFFETYVNHLGPVSVVDIGSQDINGSLREVCPKDATYIGVDFINGKGVDIVIQDPYQLPFADESHDVVVSSSCFEHSEMFWLVFTEILRILKPHGLFYMNAPSNGEFHRHPVDCWRFYPDAGGALVSWAKRCGINAALVESYTSFQENGTYNDFVAVFIKNENNMGHHENRILNHKTDFRNGLVAGNANFLNSQSLPEDLMKLKLINLCLNGKVRI